jgi:WD40 repeat protein
MLRRFIALLSLALAASACGTPALPTPTPGATQAAPDVMATAVAATLTAIAPTPTPPAPAATSTPAATAVPTETPSPSTLGFACSLAYTEWNAEGSKVYCLGEGGTPLLIADASALGTASNPAISSDGAFVAYLVNLINGTAQLWVVNVTGLASGAAPQPHLLAGPDQVASGDPNVANSPLSFAWQTGTHTLFFNTRFTLLSSEAGPGEHGNNDLWKADADSGQVINFMSRNSVGRFFLSPDGKHIALSLPQAVGLVGVNGSNFNLPLNFPFISTSSEYEYKPEVLWSATNAFFYVVVPSADPLAGDASATIYRMALDGTTQTLGALSGNFVFGGSVAPAISPDGQFVIYSRTAQDNTASLHLARIDGSGDVVIDQQQPSAAFIGFGWAPDSNHFAYAVTPSAGGFLAPVEGPLQAFVSNAQIASLKWYDGTSFAFVGQVNGQWGLYAQTIGSEPRLLVSGLDQNAMFDVRP